MMMRPFSSCSSSWAMGMSPLLRLCFSRTSPICARWFGGSFRPPACAVRSIDVVQSVWVDLLQGFRAAGWRFSSVTHLRAFLVRATRNRFIDRIRQQQMSLERERVVAGVRRADGPAAATATPCEEAEAGELWERLLALCPPGHRELLLLKRQGFSSAEIATHTGLHEGSVRRLLRDSRGNSRSRACRTWASRTPATAELSHVSHSDSAIPAASADSLSEQLAAEWQDVGVWRTAIR